MTLEVLANNEISINLFLRNSRDPCPHSSAKLSRFPFQYIFQFQVFSLTWPRGKMKIVASHFWIVSTGLTVTRQLQIVEPKCSSPPKAFEHQLSSTCTEKSYGPGDICNAECSTSILFKCECLIDKTGFSFLQSDGCQWESDGVCDMQVKYMVAKTVVKAQTSSVS